MKNGIKFIALALGVFTCPLFGTLVNSVHASESDHDEEYNFNWLDPDKKIYVLQNRKYLKGGHGVLNFMTGVGFSNPYKNTFNLDPRFAFYVNETWGVEVFYTLTSNTDNSTLIALSEATPTVLPKIRQIKSQMGAMVHYVPWYAKINVFNNILYFDWYFGAGLASISAEVDLRTNTKHPSDFAPQSLVGAVLSTGHEYHLSQNLLVRMDVTAAFYRAPVLGLTGDQTWYSNFNFGIGVGWKL